MKAENINSLKELKLRKRQVLREMSKCEGRLADGYEAMTRPVSNLAHSVREGEYEGGLPLNGMYKFALNAKRVVDMVRLGVSVYNDYKK